MGGCVNFSAGPSMIPGEVLGALAKGLPDFDGSGLSLIEMSHRGKEYGRVHERALELIGSLMGVPKGYRVLLLGGGATLQFSMVPMNLLLDGAGADYVVSGSWGRKAAAEARKFGDVRVVFDGKDSGYTTLPVRSAVRGEGASYVHLTTNETIEGVQWKDVPDVGDVPLVADMSSDVLSRPVDVGKFGLIYAGAQKNVGPAGVTIVVIREDLLERAGGMVDSVGSYLNYSVHAKANSLYNTPPVFSIWAMMLVLEWMERQGGVLGVYGANKEKARCLYGVIDESDGFYVNPVVPEFRSDMNVIWNLRSESLETEFLSAAEGAGLVGLKGHRSVGGIRASIYNAMTLDGVGVLVDFMKDFARRRG